MGVGDDDGIVHAAGLSRCMPNVSGDAFAQHEIHIDFALAFSGKFPAVFAFKKRLH